MPKMFSFRYVSLVWTIFWDSNLLFIYIYIMSCYIILGFFFSKFMNLSDKISKTACDSSCIFSPENQNLCLGRSTWIGKISVSISVSTSVNQFISIYYLSICMRRHSKYRFNPGLEDSPIWICRWQGSHEKLGEKRKKTEPYFPEVLSEFNNTLWLTE